RRSDEPHFCCDGSTSQDRWPRRRRFARPIAMHVTTSRLSTMERRHARACVRDDRRAGYRDALDLAHRGERPNGDGAAEQVADPSDRAMSDFIGFERKRFISLTVMASSASVQRDNAVMLGHTSDMPEGAHDFVAGTIERRKFQAAESATTDACRDATRRRRGGDVPHDLADALLPIRKALARIDHVERPVNQCCSEAETNAKSACCGLRARTKRLRSRP